MRTLPSAVFATGLLCGAVAAHAQRLSIGPTVSVGSSSASYAGTDLVYRNDRAFTTAYLAGFEAGIQGSLDFQNFAVQPALLYSQKGFRIDDNYLGVALSSGVVPASTIAATYHLRYLTLPINVAYSLRGSGEGFHVFAGPYIALLLGGDYTSEYTSANPHTGVPNASSWSGPVEASGKERFFYPNSQYDSDFYSRRIDAGGQAGVGYRYRGLLLRASYSQGLRNVGVAYVFDSGSSTNTFQHYVSYNRAFHISLGYLFGGKYICRIQPTQKSTRY